MRRVWLVFLCSVLALPLAAQSHISAPHVIVSLVAEHSALQTGKPAWVGVRFQLERGWHVYWINPGDSGEPPKVVWQLPPGYKAGELQFPFPHRLPLQTLMNFGYEDDALYLTQLSVPAGVPTSVVRLEAHVRWMVCRETCIPGKGSLSISIPVSASAPQPGANAQLFQDARDRLPKTPAPKAAISSQKDSFVFKVSAPAKAAEFFPFDDLQIENAAPQTFTRIPDGFQLVVKKSEQMAKLPARIRGVLVLDVLVLDVGGRRRAYKIDLPLSSRK